MKSAVLAITQLVHLTCTLWGWRHLSLLTIAVFSWWCIVNPGMSFADSGNGMVVVLRSLDLTLSCWDQRVMISDYIEFYLCGFTRKSRSKRKSDPLLQEAWEWTTRDTFRKYFLFGLFCIGIMAFLPPYLHHQHPIEQVLWIDPLDFYRLAVYGAFGLCLYCCIQFGHFPLGFALGYAFGFPYHWPFINVHQSYKIQHFWKRWNRLNAMGLKRLSFDRLKPYIGTTLSFISCFLLSGLWHTMIIYLLTGQVNLQQMTFFVLQSVLIVLEQLLWHLVLISTGKPLDKLIPKPILSIGVFWLLLVFSPLFLNPLIQNKVFMEVASMFHGIPGIRTKDRFLYWT